MKKLFYSSSIVILPILGIGLDSLREVIRKHTSLPINVVPITVFFVLANILFMSVVIWLSVQLSKNSFSKPISLILLISGLFIVGQPVLFGTGVDPIRFILAFAGFPIYTYLAGAFLFITGRVNIFSLKKEGNNH
ncbi:MAG: hypothetical protein FD147_951 [Chloroflexi bacterium]|nr:MAG: hypothetical protein FD147_951 [Chloroflexota bacterium]